MKILAIGAHLDDIELACGGTIAHAIKNGHQVKMIVMSKSGYNNWEGDCLRTDALARQEGFNAAKTLGVTDLEILDFPNKEIPYGVSAIEVLDEKISLYNPELIFTHWAFDTHQDHVATSKDVIAAARYFNSILMFEPIAPSGRSYVAFRPQIYINIEDGMAEKEAALKAHLSQYEKYGDRWVEAATSRAKYRGFELGCNYAECFEIVRYEAKL